MWTDNEKEELIRLYPDHSNKELCSILNKTEGQIRGMKERLGLNSKFKPFTDEEKRKIREYYISHPDAIDINTLADEMGRQKTSISRFARSEGLTKYDRRFTAEQAKNYATGFKKYINSEYYNECVKPAHTARLIDILHNNHPRGMLGKHHTQEVCSRISEAMINRWDSMTDSEKAEQIKKRKETLIAHGGRAANKNAYSRCHGRYREDIGQYFRSAWEANIARCFNHLGIHWEYEPKRFIFEDTGDGILSYCPDFYLSGTDNWVEVKGWMDDKSIERLEKFSKYYPEEYAKLILIDEQKYRDIQYEADGVVGNWEYT